MDITILAAMIFFAVLILALGIWRENLVLKGFSGVLFLIPGLMVLDTGIDVLSGGVLFNTTNAGTTGLGLTFVIIFLYILIDTMFNVKALQGQ